MATENLCCPECSSTKVVAMASQWWMVNTGEFFGHCAKTHDDHTEVGCLDCNWQGIRYQLVKSNP